MESGDIFFAKKIRTAPTSRKRKIYGNELTLKGHVVGLTLGYIPPDEVPPEARTLWLLMLNAGYVGGDDIIDCLGDEAMQKLVDHVRKKYGDNDEPSKNK